MKFGAVENKARLAILVLILSLLSLVGLSLALFARAGSVTSSPLIIYLFSYQIIALVFGIGLVFLLIRWLLRPYRRMVEAAKGSPVRASSAMSESEFVAQTFQALIDQLQSKERELAALHALERNRAERSERFSERLVANIPSGLITVDSKGLVTSVNAHAMKIFAAAESSPRLKQMKQIQTGELLSPIIDYRSFFSATPRMQDMISECLENATAFRREEVEVAVPGGNPRRIGLSISPISDAAQNVEGALCLMTDITEVIELRERMKLKDKLANLGEMAAGLAHEFKNSLATIHGYVQLLDAQAVGPAPEADRRLTLDAALNEVRLLSKLVTDFLNFARPEDLHLVQVDLLSIIQTCVEEIQSRSIDQTIEFNIEGEFAEVPGDESLLRRAFINLFRNAAEAIDLQSSRKLILITGTVDSGTDARYAHIRVRDTGSGIAPSDLQRIFIPFFTTKSRGYGIGLALVQKIVVAHGGDVSVEKSDATGTMFHCRLPLSTPSSPMEDE
jgi:signal transduction histidine kinase